MAGELNNVTTADTYTAANTRAAPSSARVRILVRNASIYYQYGYGGQAGAVNYDAAERFLPPGGYPLDESQKPFDGIRVRSATPGKPAQVTVDCVHG